MGRLVRALPFAFAIYLVLRAILGPSLWPLSVVEPFLLWVCLPSFGLLIVGLVRRRWRAATAHAVIAASWLWMFAHFLVPPSPPPAIRGPVLHLLSFNLGAGLASHAQLVELLRRTRADVVLLQELTAAEARALDQDLLDLYPHRDLHGLGISGLGVLSNSPLLDSELFHLDSRRPYQRCVIEVGGVRTTLFNVHPGLLHLVLAPWSDNAHDMAWLGAAARDSGSGIIAGDLNVTENMDLCVRLAESGMQDAFRAAGTGLGLTFPVFGRYRGLPIPPSGRIDYVWHTDEFFCREARVLADAGSDHYPLFVALERR